MRTEFCDTPDDCRWLRETHLKSVADVPPFASFTLDGNDDCPQRITLYSSQDPRHDDAPAAVYILNDDLTYSRADA